MRKLHVNTKDASYEELVRIARRCDFAVFEGCKHCKIKTSDGRFVTTIPRHNRLKRETAKGIVEALNGFGAGITLN